MLVHGGGRQGTTKLTFGLTYITAALASELTRQCALHVDADIITYKTASPFPPPSLVS